METTSSTKESPYQRVARKRREAEGTVAGLQSEVRDLKYDQQKLLEFSMRLLYKDFKAEVKRLFDLCSADVEHGFKSFTIDGFHDVRMIMRAHPADSYTDVLTEDSNSAIKIKLSPTDILFENVKTGSGFMVDIPPFLRVYPGLKRAESDPRRGSDVPTVKNAYDYFEDVKKSAQENPTVKLVNQHEALTGIMSVVERAMPKHEQTS